MKEITSVFQSDKHPEWTCLNFKAYRTKENVLVFPKERWVDTSIIEELGIKVGDMVE